MENMNRAAGLVIPTEAPQKENPKINGLLQGIREATIEVKRMSEIIIAGIITGSGNPKENVKHPSPKYDSMAVIEKLEYLRIELRDARENYRKIISVLR